MESMRKEWFNFVAVTRKRMQRKTKETVTHRQAMKEASALWPKEKAKILNRRKREERKKAKGALANKAKPAPPQAGRTSSL
mgnify:CR=1 FL=1